MPDDTTEIDPSELDPYLKPRAAGLIIPPTGTTPPPDMEIDPSELGPYVAGPITSHDNPTLSRSKEPSWFPYVDEPTKIAAQIAGQTIGTGVGAATGALAGGAVASGPGALAGGAVGDVTGAAAGQVVQAYAIDKFKRALGYNPDSPDYKEQAEAGAAGALAGKILPMAATHLGVPIARKLLGVDSIYRTAGEDAVLAQQAAIDKAGTETVGPLAAKVQSAAEQSAAERWVKSGLETRLGTNAGEVTARNSASTEAEEQATKSALARSAHSLLLMTDAPRKQAGRAIEQFWEGHLTEQVPTTGYSDLAQGLGFDPLSDEIRGPTGHTAPGPVSRRVLDLVRKISGTGEQTPAGRILDMQREAELLARTATSPREQQLLTPIRERLDESLSSDEFLSPELRAIKQPLNDAYSGAKKYVTDANYKAIRTATTRGDQFEALSKIDDRGYEGIMRRATQNPEDLRTLREGATEYFTGEDPKDIDGMRQRVEKLYTKSPEAYRQMFEGTPMADPRAMIRAPLYAAKAADAFQYPKFQSYFADAFKEELETPQGQQLRAELTKYNQMPEPESMRQQGITDLLQHRAGAGSHYGYIERRVLYAGLIAALSGGQYTSFLKSPTAFATIGAVLASRRAFTYFVSEHPEAYWNFVSAIGKGATPEAARIMGKWGADLAIMTAIDGMHKKAQAARDVATSTPERVEGVPAPSGPDAVAVP